ncbi:MAG TPA: branched-chain amino acid ABC transporter permease [Gaiellaceae bacterium]
MTYPSGTEGGFDARALWRQQRDRWHHLPERTRTTIVLVVQVLIVLLLLPWWWGFAVLLAIFFALYWIPEDLAVPLGTRKLRVRAFVTPLVALALAILYPYVRDHIDSLPGVGPWPQMDTAVIMTVYAMMAVGLNIVVGYAGLLDLGYVAFYAVGAYTAAWFASVQFAKQNIHFGSVGVGATVPGIHISVWILLILAGIVTAFIGVVIGLPTLRLRGDYLAIVTLGFGEILPQVARNGDNLGGFNLTNGPNGITPIDPPGFGKTLHDATGGALPDNYLALADRNKAYFYTGVVLLAITVFASLRLRDSRLGRAWIAIREDEIAAAAMGIPLMRTKTWAYASGAFFGGVAGAFFASFKSSTFPNDFSFNISAFILSMVILGGMGNVWGVIVGGAVLAYLNQEGLANIGAKLGIADVPLYASGIFGAILVIMMLLRPAGLLPSARVRAELEEGVHDQPLYDASG